MQSKLCWCNILLALFAGAATAGTTNQSVAESWVPFHLPWETPAGSPSDARPWIEAPAGKRGPLTVREGHFCFKDGTRARFWGINIAGEGCCPSRETAVRMADRLARFGFNLVRLHALDADWGKALFRKNPSDTQHFDPEQLEKLDFLIAELEKRGIYINLNLHVARRFKPGDGLPQTEWLGYSKYCVIFDPRMLELQQDYARRLFTHRNPHTGRTYAQDPAVIITELSNEDSLFGGWTSGHLRGKQTSRPRNTSWTDIPPYYGEELTRFFNTWLKERYPDRASLARAWQPGLRPAGAQLLSNGDFSSGAKGWELTRRAPAAAELDITNDTAEVKACARATVTAVTGTRYHLMLTQRPLAVRKDMQYRVVFRARASSPRPMSVEVCRSSPYRDFGHARFELGEQWQEFHFAFTAPEMDPQARLSFHLGEALGTIWIDDVVLQEAPCYGLRDGEDAATGTVKRLEPEEFSTATLPRFRDEAHFYRDTERRYYETMYQFLRQDLQVGALIEGTSHNYGLPNLWNESVMDLMDCHDYWQHPHFPEAKPWSSTEWSIANTPMLGAPENTTIARLARSAVLGKPFTVSEYNHPFPNEYGCEMPLLLAAYASLQDWDAFYGFAFLHRPDERALGGDCVTGYFDLCNDVPKLAQMPTASLLFLRGDVQPASQLVKVSYDEARCYDSLREPHYEHPYFHLPGGLSPLLPLVHRFRVERFDAPQTTRAEDIAFQEPKGLISSDTGELRWQQAPPRNGRLLINTPRAQAAVGGVGGETLRTADAAFRLKTAFCAVSLVALDDRPLASSRKILLVAAARCANTGMEWNQERTSLGNRWGGPPLLIEPVEGVIELRREQGAPELKLTPLDGRGLPKAGMTVRPEQQGQNRLLSLRPGDATVWYVLAP